MAKKLVEERISYLKSREKELLYFLICNNFMRFTPIEISHQTGVTNKTVINRLLALVNNGFVDPLLVKERIRSYALSRFTRSNINEIRKTLNKDINILNKDHTYEPVDHLINAEVNSASEKLLEQLLIEGYSGQKLLDEFRKRQIVILKGINSILQDAKCAPINGYGEDVSYERMPESKDISYKKNIWDTAIGLQAVDGLKTSEYLNKLAEENISGRKSYEDIGNALKKEYGNAKSRQQEADTVALRIAQLLEQSEFMMTIDLILAIHEFLFEDVLEPELAGRFRKYNIRKKEPVLLGDSVRYTDHLAIRSQLNFILEEENKYTYANPMTKADITHLSEFTRNIWQTHPFGEGNTRTTAVFIELYLISLGYEINNKPFRDNSDYYRNALVRSCYASEGFNVHPTYKFLNRFYMNLLNGADNKLDSFDLFISNE